MRASEAELLRQLQEAKEGLKERDGFLEQLSSEPSILSTVIGVEKNEVVAAGKDGVLLVQLPKKMEILIGDTVVVHVKSRQIIKKSPYKLYGPKAVIERVLSATIVEVGIEGHSVKRYARYENSKFSFKEGDEVSLDETGNCVVERFQIKKTTRSFEGRVTWDNVGGLDSVKEELRDAVETPLHYAELYKSYNRTPPKGFLLYGPPGCGKTLLGKAVATSIADIHGIEASATGFQYIKATEILAPLVGVGEGKIRKIFRDAQEHKREHGYPCVIFIDEAEAILKTRGKGISSDVNETMVATFLTEMDGMGEMSAIVILATNRPDIIDPAVIREGRIDRRIEIPRPGHREVKDIFSIHLNKYPLDKEETIESLSSHGLEETFAEVRGLQNIVTGSMIASCVDAAVKNAMKDDIVSKKKKGNGCWTEAHHRSCRIPFRFSQSIQSELFTASRNCKW